MGNSNRPLKFRAWDKRYKRFIHFDLSDIAEIPEGNGHYHPGISSLDGDISANSFHDSLAVQPDYILMQYTGLRDKNGKEIYEGDIYRFLSYEVRYGKQIRPERIRVVANETSSWIQTCFELRNLLDAGHFELEIIGNIYENHDLVPNT